MTRLTRSALRRWAGTLIVTIAATASAGVASGGQGAPRVADAVERRDAGLVTTLLDGDADVNAPQPDGATALHWAAHWNDLSTAGRLLDAGADENAANDLGVTPVMLAAENGSGPMMRRLLEAGADASAAVSTGEPVLMRAARSGGVEAVTALLEAGAVVDAREPTRGQTALMWAAAQRHPAVVRVLIEHGADPYARSAVRRRSAHIGTRFGDRSNYTGVVDVDRGGFTPLLFAAREGAVEVARVLLELGANPDDVAADGTSALVLAAHSGQSAFARFLLDNGADANAAGSGYTALHAATLRGDIALVDALAAAGARIDGRLLRGTPTRYWGKDYALSDIALVGASPFWLAARFGDVPLMRTLFAAGADPNFAIHRPARRTPGLTGVAERGLGSRSVVPNGTTVLMVSITAHGGYVTGDRREQYLSEADRALLPEGEDARVTLETVTAAVQMGADVNAADLEGNTALHLASMRRLVHVVEYLATAGADVHAENLKGQTPLALVVLPGDRGAYEADEGDSPRLETAALLRRWGATDPATQAAAPDAPAR